VLAQDVGRLDTRVDNLRRHFNQAEKDIGEIQTSARKITSRADKIEQIEMGEDAAEASLQPPEAPAKPRLVSGGDDG